MMDKGNKKIFYCEVRGCWGVYAGRMGGRRLSRFYWRVRIIGLS
jgi:hypothetical protein